VPSPTLIRAVEQWGGASAVVSGGKGERRRWRWQWGAGAREKPCGGGGGARGGLCGVFYRRPSRWRWERGRRAGWDATAGRRWPCAGVVDGRTAWRCLGQAATARRRRCAAVAGAVRSARHGTVSPWRGSAQAGARVCGGGAGGRWGTARGRARGGGPAGPGALRDRSWAQGRRARVESAAG